MGANTEIMKGGDVRVLQRKSKTDQEGVGVEWHIPAGRQGVVGPAELIQWYWRNVGKPRSGFMFGSFRSVKGEVRVNGSRPIGYDTVRKQFKAMCMELGLPELDIHSCRIGGASEASRLGAPSEVVKRTGGWKSAAVDGYIRPEGPMKMVVDLLTRK